MSSPNYYVGDYRQDGLHGGHNGWIVGSFMPEGLLKLEEVEIKYWEFAAGEEAKSYQKESAIVECTFILKGRTRCLVNGDEIELKAGDYIVIHPGTPNNTVAEILEDAQGLTIKAPSDTTAKKILG
jgi:quercetin dioxygenase-like cupin family protein